MCETEACLSYALDEGRQKITRVLKVLNVVANVLANVQLIPRYRDHAPVEPYGMGVHIDMRPEERRNIDGANVLTWCVKR